KARVSTKLYSARRRWLKNDLGFHTEQKAPNGWAREATLWFSPTIVLVPRDCIREMKIFRPLLKRRSFSFSEDRSLFWSALVTTTQSARDKPPSGSRSLP